MILMGKSYKSVLKKAPLKYVSYQKSVEFVLVKLNFVKLNMSGRAPVAFSEELL